VDLRAKGHCHLFPWRLSSPVLHFRGREACIFTTRSRRGEYLAEIIRLFRYHPCLIPEGSGGHIALDLMVREIQSGHNAVIVADGPKGPYHQVKHGALVLAARTGNPILPVGIASACRIVLRHRWDRYTIPLPLTRAVIAIGDPIFVPKRIGNSGLESLRRRLEDELVRLNRQARASLSGRHSPDRAV